jgi:4-hydroxythreonine-4-phosphate dehydrogenase
MNQKIILGITQGDPNGIGYEVIIKALADARMLELCTPIIYGSSRTFGFYKKQVPNTEGLNTNIINSASDCHPKRINIINCVPDNFKVEPGQPSNDAAMSSIMALQACVKDLKEGLIDAMITAPFNKKAVSDSSFGFPGHTEYLINEFGAADGLMFLCSDQMKVGVVTNHLPLSKVSESLNTDLILRKIKLMHTSLCKDFNIIKPKIAVLGVNPHCGDGGLLGSEEINIICPAVKKANDENILAFGPYSPDGFFGNNMQSDFDAVLAMYHDQGLIPFKSLSFDCGVNFTAGLPVVRTSPDHGTAYELAGKNEANAMPMISAIYAAIDIVRNRRLYEEMRADMLQISNESEKEGIKGPV